MLHKARPTQKHHPTGNRFKTKRKSKRSSAFGRRLTSPSSNFPDATHQQHIRDEYSPIKVFPALALSPHSLTLQNTSADTRDCTKSTVKCKKSGGLNHTAVSGAGGGGGGRIVGRIV